MGRTRTKKRIGAWILALVMIVSLVTVPAGEVQAADGDIVTIEGEMKDVIDTSKDVYVSIEEDGIFEKYSNDEKNWPSEDLQKYKLTIHNNTDTTISDWKLVMSCGNSLDLFSGWNGVSSSGTDIVAVTYQGTNADGETWNNINVESGESVTGAGFMLPSRLFNVTSCKLTYKVGSSDSASQDDTATDPATIGSTSSSVTASFTKNEISGEYHAYFLQINNGLSESISDWIVAIKMSDVSSVEQWDTSWAKLKEYYTSEYLYLTPSDGSGAVIAAKGTYGSSTDGAYKFNYKGNTDIGNLSADSIKVYYKTGSSYQGSFSSVTANATAGTGSGSSSSGSSTGETFDGSNIGTIDTSTDYNFAKLLQYSLYFYDANMCGDQVSETSLYSRDLYDGWRGDCHVNDSFTYNGKTYSAVGGYHDAGDHVKFGLPMAQAMTALGIGYHEFGEAFEELGQTSHLKTILDYYCTYVKSCTVLNEAGTKAEAFCYQVGHGQPDHQSWCAPEVENETATDRSYTLVATSDNPASDVVGGTVAALTLNYLNFGNEEDLKYAKALFVLAKNDGKQAIGDKDGSFYGSGSWKDEYCLAAALLYKATNDEQYKTEYNNNNDNSGNIQKPYGWDNAYQAAAFYAPTQNSNELSTINSWFASVANNNSSQYYCADSWGSARINCNVQLMMMVYDNQQNVDTYSEWCKYQMSIILGNNSTGKNLVCGYNTNSPTKPHHRAASGYSGWDQFNSNATQAYTLYGALVGGPTSSDFSTYNDSVNDAVSNEVTLDYNAGLVGAAAALYLKYKDSTEEGFTNQTINADFYGGANFAGATGTTTVSVEKVELDNTTLSLQEGNTATLTATVTPSEATSKNVTWKSSNTSVATVKSGVVTAVAAGTATITATAGGKSATCEVTVTAKPTANLTGNATTITAKEYGYTNPGATTITIKNEGNADATNVAAALKGSNFSVTTQPTTSIKQGESTTVAVTPVSGLAAGKYTDTLTVTYDTGKSLAIPVTFTVNKRAVTVTADSLSKVYGEENPTLTYTITGSVVDGDNLNIQCSTTATKTSDAGEYVITVTASNDNYDITTVKGTLTITKKEVTDIVFPTAEDITFGETLAEATLSQTSSDYGTYAWADSTIKPEKRGTVLEDVVLTLSAPAKKNYNFKSVNGYNETAGTVTQKVSVNVKRAGLPDITFPTVEGTLVYGSTLADAVLTGGSTDYGTFKWENENTVLNTIGSTSYPVTFTWNETIKTQYNILDADEDATLTKEVTVTVVKKPNTATPETPTVASKTNNSITVKVDATEDYEYSIDKGTTWKSAEDSNQYTFTGLTGFTEYTIYSRIKETDIQEASAKSAACTQYTLVKDPYTVDVSKLAGDNAADYVEALCTADGTPTVSYNEESKVLTLSDASKTYTIIGSNDDVTVKMTATENETSNIVLKNTDISALEVIGSNDVTVTAEGTSNVKDTIGSSSKEANVTITGSGSLNVGAIQGKDVTVSSGTVAVSDGITASGNVTVSGGTVAADKGIVASGDVTVSGSNTKVTATGNGPQAGISATGTVTITNATVEAAAGTGAAIESTNGDVVITDATVTVTLATDSDTAAIKVDEGKTITLNGNNAISASQGDVDNDKIYSTQPKDVAGNVIEECKVTVVDSEKEASTSESKKLKNSIIILKAQGKEGYTVSWTASDGNTYSDLDEVVITGEVTFTAVYEPILVTAIEIKVSDTKLKEKATATASLVAVTPDDALNRDVEWCSNNTGVATIDEQGKITAVSAGETDIYAKAKDDSGISSNKVHITVEKTENADNQNSSAGTEDAGSSEVKATSLSVTANVKGASAVPVKSTYKLAPKKSMTLKVAFLPEGAATEKLTYTSSNPKIATVNGSGKVTAGKKAGKATITVTSESGLKKTFKVQVMKKAVTKVKIKGSTTMKAKKKQKLKVTLKPGKASASNVVFWKSSNTKVATVSASGQVKALKKGKVKITAVATDGSGKKATITIKVK